MHAYRILFKSFSDSFSISVLCLSSLLACSQGARKRMDCSGGTTSSSDPCIRPARREDSPVAARFWPSCLSFGRARGRGVAFLSLSLSLRLRPTGESTGTLKRLLPSRQRSDQRKASSSLCVLVEQRLFGPRCLGSKCACGSSLGSLCIAPVVPGFIHEHVHDLVMFSQACRSESAGAVTRKEMLCTLFFVFVQLRNCQQLHDSSLVICQRTKAPPAIS